MRLRLSLRIDSRKSRRSLAILFLLSSATLSAQIAHTTSLLARESHLEVSMLASAVDPDAFLGNIEEGFTSRLEFTMRFSPATTGILGIGANAYPQYTVTHDAWWDPFRDRYIIESNDGATYTFSDASALWEFFFSLPGLRVPWNAIDGEVVIDSRVAFYPVVFAPGLRILAVLLRDSRQTTAWQTHEVPARP